MTRFWGGLARPEGVGLRDRLQVWLQRQSRMLGMSSP